MLSIVAILCFSGVTSAHADYVVPEPEPPRESYGASILIMDGIGWGLTLASFQSSIGKSDVGPIFGLSGLATLALGGPIVHGLNGNVGKGMGSFLLRTLTPLAGFALGVTFSNASGSEFAEFGTGLKVGGVALVGVQLFDALFLAKRSPASDRGRARARLWTPTLVVTGEVSAVGVASAW